MARMVHMGKSIENWRVGFAQFPSMQVRVEEAGGEAEWRERLKWMQQMFRRVYGQRRVRRVATTVGAIVCALFFVLVPRVPKTLLLSTWFQLLVGIVNFSGVVCGCVGIGWRNLDPTTLRASLGSSSLLLWLPAGILECWRTEYLLQAKHGPAVAWSQLAAFLTSTVFVIAFADALIFPFRKEAVFAYFVLFTLQLTRLVDSWLGWSAAEDFVVARVNGVPFFESELLRFSALQTVIVLFRGMGSAVNDRTGSTSLFLVRATPLASLRKRVPPLRRPAAALKSRGGGASPLPGAATPTPAAAPPSPARDSLLPARPPPRPLRDAASRVPAPPHRSGPRGRCLGRVPLLPRTPRGRGVWTLSLAALGVLAYLAAFFVTADAPSALLAWACLGLGVAGCAGGVWADVHWPALCRILNATVLTSLATVPATAALDVLRPDYTRWQYTALFCVLVVTLPLVDLLRRPWPSRMRFALVLAYVSLWLFLWVDMTFFRRVHDSDLFTLRGRRYTFLQAKSSVYSTLVTVNARALILAASDREGSHAIYCAGRWPRQMDTKTIRSHARRVSVVPHIAMQRNPAFAAVPPQGVRESFGGSEALSADAPRGGEEKRSLYPRDLA